MNNACRELKVCDSRGRLDIIKTTDLHPFWSETRSCWVKAFELEQGEQLQGCNGIPLSVVNSSRIAGKHTVFNLTIEGDHVFRVGNSALLVHNNCWEAEVRPNKDVWVGDPISEDEAIDQLKQGGDILTDDRGQGWRIADGAGDGQPVWDGPSRAAGGVGEKGTFTLSTGTAIDYLVMSSFVHNSLSIL